MNKRAFIPIVFLLVSACSRPDRDVSARIEAEFNANATAPINLALIVPSAWDRVCVLPPYTDNKQAASILGFEWNSDFETSIGGSDGINVLVFIQGSEVVAYTEHRRDKGDFSRMQPRCLKRDRATVFRHIDPDPRNNGWVHLGPAQ
jgi:hypothetical protein